MPFPNYGSTKRIWHEFGMTSVEALSKLIGFVENACFPQQPNVNRLLGTETKPLPFGVSPILAGGGRIIGIFPVKSSSKMPAFS